MVNNGIDFNEYFYCYHHPQGVIKDYSGQCPCRKPKPHFLLKAREKYDIDMGQSWIVGDQDSDILCGQAAGVNTILIEEKHSKNKRGKSRPNYYAESLDRAVDIILKKNNPRS
jgi:D-glycero-D-manno-heptose 1,7-bisphosphate phosphatase